jgi:hypothetical protein
MSKNELVTRQAEPGSPVPVVPERATRVASWIGWHLFEITGVTVPAVLALTVSPWWWLVSGVVGAGWTANVVRVTQATEATRSLASRDESPAADDGSPADRDVFSVSDEKSGVDGKRVGGVR